LADDLLLIYCRSNIGIPQAILRHRMQSCAYVMSNAFYPRIADIPSTGYRKMRASMRLHIDCTKNEYYQ